MKKVISCLLCFSLIFSAVIPPTANATTLATVDTVEETNFIQQMLDKLEQIIGLMAKTGSITVKCTDENDNVIYQKTDADLKFGSYCDKINENKIFFKTNLVQLKRCTSKGDYKRQEFRCGKMLNLPKAKIQGFKKYDTVKYFGKRYFIKGGMSNRFVMLADIDLNKIDFSFLGRGRKTPKLQNLKRISSRKSWIVDQKAIQNI